VYELLELILASASLYRIFSADEQLQVHVPRTNLAGRTKEEPPGRTTKTQHSYSVNAFAGGSWPLRVATASVASGGLLSTVSCAVGAESNSPIAPTTAIPFVAPIPSVFWPFGDLLGEQELTERLRHFYILPLVLTDDSRCSNT